MVAPRRGWLRQPRNVAQANGARAPRKNTSSLSRKIARGITSRLRCRRLLGIMAHYVTNVTQVYCTVLLQ